MSRRCLALAVRDQLRDTLVNGGLALSLKDCGLAPIDGRPPAWCGERYVGVFVGARATARVTHGLKEVYSVHVVVTYRINGMVPFDRLGDSLMEKASNGFDDFADAIRANLNADYYNHKVLIRANNYLNPDQIPLYGLFARGIEFMGDDVPHAVGPDWFLGSADSKNVGIVQTLRFGGIERIQSAVTGTDQVIS